MKGLIGRSNPIGGKWTFTSVLTTFEHLSAFPHELEQKPQSVLVDLLKKTSDSGIPTITGPIDCSTFKGTGSEFAKALQAAAHIPAIQRLKTKPELHIVAYSRTDQKLYNDFLKEWNNLQRASPHSAKPNATASTGAKGGTATPARQLSSRNPTTHIGTASKTIAKQSLKADLERHIVGKIANNKVVRHNIIFFAVKHNTGTPYDYLTKIRKTIEQYKAEINHRRQLLAEKQRPYKQPQNHPNVK